MPWKAGCLGVAIVIHDSRYIRTSMCSIRGWTIVP